MKQLGAFLKIFDPTNPAVGGQAFATLLVGDVTRHPKWPHRSSSEHELVAAVIDRSKKLVADFLVLLPPLGFDEDEIEAFRRSAVDEITQQIARGGTVH